MGMHENLDISAYLVLGPEDTLGRPLASVVAQALDAGFTCFQVRSKTCSARELIECVREAANAIAAAGKSEEVALVVDDRLDVVLTARDLGIKVDGVHVGQSDIPVETCRKYLGDDAIVGLSADTREMIEYVRAADTSCIDYFGVGPLHDTQSKRDLVVDEQGNTITQTLADLRELARITPLPVVVGGGVKAADVPSIAETGLHGFFVISAVCSAKDPGSAACELVQAWKGAKAKHV